MRRSLLFFLLSIPLFLSNSCKISSETTTETPKKEGSGGYGEQAVLWQQNAAEYKALCYQAYQLAELRLNQILTDESNAGKNMAIVTDIDETLLDNSPYQATRLMEGTSYSAETWQEWVEKARAKPIAGALSFFKKTKQAGLSIYYLSDRLENQEKATLANLKKFGFPDADRAHLLFKKDGENKEVRREKVLDAHKVVLYLGDNLSDFSEVFDHQSTEKRNFMADSLHTEFGKRFIVLPNPTYGAWETDGIFEGNHDWTPKEKDSIIRAKLKTY